MVGLDFIPSTARTDNTPGYAMNVLLWTGPVRLPEGSEETAPTENPDTLLYAKLEVTSPKINIDEVMQMWLAVAGEVSFTNPSGVTTVSTVHDVVTCSNTYQTPLKHESLGGSPKYSVNDYFMQDLPGN